MRSKLKKKNALIHGYALNFLMVTLTGVYNNLYLPCDKCSCKCTVNLIYVF